MNRSPSSSTRIAPAPLSASVIRNDCAPAKTVGWNWTNSRSAIRAPARAASRIPLPLLIRLLVVRPYRPAYPPVASTVALARRTRPPEKAAPPHDSSNISDCRRTRYRVRLQSLIFDESCGGAAFSGGLVLRASATVLATGGYAGLYGRTTNSRISNGKGILEAARAGARIADLEFVQFHPT